MNSGWRRELNIIKIHLASPRNAYIGVLRRDSRPRRGETSHGGLRWRGEVRDGKRGAAVPPRRERGPDPWPLTLALCRRHQAGQRVHHGHRRGEAGGPGARALLQLQNHRCTFLRYPPPPPATRTPAYTPRSQPLTALFTRCSILTSLLKKTAQAFVTAGSWLTSSDQLPAWNGLTNSSYVLKHLVTGGPASRSDKLPALAEWPASLALLYDQLGHAGWPAQTQLDQHHDQLGHAGWPAQTQLDQHHDQLGHAGWPAHTQLDQLHDQLGHAGWPAHTQLDQIMTQFSSWSSYLR